MECICAKSKPDGTLGHFDWPANSPDLDPSEQHVKQKNKTTDARRISPSYGQSELNVTGTHTCIGGILA